MRKGYQTTEVSSLIGPFPLSCFNQKLKDVEESIYASNKLYPLGRTRPPDIPKEAANLTFGAFSAKGDSVNSLICPSNTFIKNSNYRDDYNVPKQTVVKDAAGLIRPPLVDQVKAILTTHPEGMKTRILPLKADSKRYNYVEEKDEKIEAGVSSYSILGKDDSSEHLDPIKFKSKRYRNEQTVVEVLWNLLKMKNCCNFPDFATAFKAYDQKNTGKLTVEDIQAMCLKFGISVSIQIIQKLVSKCDVLDKDGMISYQEFIHCLNWKDMLPEKLGQKVEKYANDWRECMHDPTMSVLDQYKTESCSIGEHYSKVPPKTAGLPTLRTDKVSPQFKKVSDCSDYGDLKNASGVIQPNVFAEYGVYERDLARLCSKQQIMNLLKKCGYLVKEEILDSIWNNTNGRPSLGMALHSLKQKCF